MRMPPYEKYITEFCSCQLSNKIGEKKKNNIMRNKTEEFLINPIPDDLTDFNL